MALFKTKSDEEKLKILQAKRRLAEEKREILDKIAKEKERLSKATGRGSFLKSLKSYAVKKINENASTTRSTIRAPQTRKPVKRKSYHHKRKPQSRKKKIRRRSSTPRKRKPISEFGDFRLPDFRF